MISSALVIKPAGEGPKFKVRMIVNGIQANCFGSSLECRLIYVNWILHSLHVLSLMLLCKPLYSLRRVGLLSLMQARNSTTCECSSIKSSTESKGRFQFTACISFFMRPFLSEAKKAMMKALKYSLMR